MPDNIISDGLATFFNNGISHRNDALQDIIHELECIHQWLLQQTKFHFYCSSLLFIYNGDVDICSSRNNRKATVKLIDFAHATINETTLDSNFIYGIEKLLEHLYRLTDIVNN